jgi:hypothetical protein
MMLRRPPLSLFVLALALIAMPAYSQVFEVISIDGSAKAQRVQKKEWEKLSIGTQLGDNDIAESFFQTKCVLRFGKGNVVIIGSNSKVLLNIRERQTASGALLSEVNLTLFSGACFVKAIAQAHIGVYTSNAVGETDSGSFSTVVESRTGETGFQVIGGKVRTRNIAQKEGVDCISGQTTMIFPGKEPTAPLYITYKHVSVLKHFFGEEYIQSEMDMAGIKPTEDRTSRSSTLLSDAMMEGRYRNNQDLTSYKIPFSLNKIYGAILNDRNKRKELFSPLSPSSAKDFKGFSVGLRSSFAAANGGLYPILALVPCYTSDGFDAAIKLPLASNYTSTFSMYGFSSFAGIMDKIDHVLWQPTGGRFLLSIGAQNNLTIGNGNVVSGFSNRNPYCLFQPLGLLGAFAANDLTGQAFIADITQFSIGGVRVEYAPTLYRFGVGYFFDADQFQKISPQENNRIKLRPDSLIVNPDSASLGLSIYEFDFAWDILLAEDFQTTVGADFAQRLISTGTDGFVFNMPRISLNWNRMKFETAIVTESGRLIEGQFNSFYMANRWSTFHSSLGDTLVTQNSILSPNRICHGLKLSFAINPHKGAMFEVTLRQNVIEHNTFSNDATKAKVGTDFSLSFCMNDSLFKPIRFGELYVRQEHSGLYPPHSSLFSSWEFSIGAAVVTHPLYYGISIDAGLSFCLLDMNFNNRIDPGEGMLDFSIGLSKGF